VKGKNIAPQWGEDRAGEFVKQLRRRGVTGEHVQSVVAEKGGRHLDGLAHLLCNQGNPHEYGDAFVELAVKFCAVAPWTKAALIDFLALIPTEIAQQAFENLLVRLRQEAGQASQDKNMRLLSNFTSNLTMLEEFFASKSDEHEHVFRSICIRNPDAFFRAFRGDVLCGKQCIACAYYEQSPGWDGSKRIRRNELCEVCDGPVEKTDSTETQEIGIFIDPRIIYYYKCQNCGHRQYYFKG